MPHLQYCNKEINRQILLENNIVLKKTKKLFNLLKKIQKEIKPTGNETYYKYCGTHLRALV